jgi:hypothetical protein
LDLGAFEYSPPTLTSLRIQDGTCVLDFTSVPGAVYDLLKSLNITSAWTPLITNIPGADGFTEVMDTNLGAGFQTFYRIRSSL